jgi:hypothetical protein
LVWAIVGWEEKKLRVAREQQFLQL